MPVYETKYYPFYPFSYGGISVTAEILEDSATCFKIGLTMHFPDTPHFGIYNGMPKENWRQFREAIIQSLAEKQYYQCQFIKANIFLNPHLPTVF